MQTQTHDLTFTDGEVRKRYVSWDRGEDDREWACLTLLAEHAPGVAPRPLRRETYDGAGLVDAVGLSDDERDRMLGYRPLWAAFWLVMLLPGNSGFDRNPPGTTETQATRVLSLLD